MASDREEMQMQFLLHELAARQRELDAGRDIESSSYLQLALSTVAAGSVVVLAFQAAPEMEEALRKVVPTGLMLLAIMLTWFAMNVAQRLVSAAQIERYMLEVLEPRLEDLFGKPTDGRANLAWPKVIYDRLLKPTRKTWYWHTLLVVRALLSLLPSFVVATSAIVAMVTDYFGSSEFFPLHVATSVAWGLCFLLPSLIPFSKLASRKR